MHISLSKFFNSGGGGGREPIVESIAIIENGTYTPNEGIDGFNEVNVNVPIPTFTTEELSATANGEYTPTTDGYTKVTVAVPTPEPNLQSKNIEIAENGTQIISADEGYDGLHNVEVRTNVPLTPQDVIVWRDGMGFNDGEDKNEAGEFLDKVDFSNVTNPYGLFRNIYFFNTKSFNPILEKIGFELKYKDVSYMFDNAFIVSNDRDLHFDLLDLSQINKCDSMFRGFNSSSGSNTLMSLYFDSMRMHGNNIFEQCCANQIHITNPIVSVLSSCFKNAHIASKLYMPNVESTDITSLSYLFSNATIGEMDISNWKLPNLVNIDYFADSANLSELTFEGWETGIITQASEAFKNSKLKKLDLTNLKLNLDASDIRDLFHNCSLLTDLNLSNYDMTAFSPRYSSAIYYPFYQCNALTNIVTNENTKLPDKNWAASNFNNCPNLTAESMVNLFNALPVSTKGYTFTVGTDNLAKLSDDQKSIATAKGWALS